MQISRTRLKNSNIHFRVRHCEWFFFFFFFFFWYFERKVAKRQTARDFCRFSEANSESIEVYVSIARFQPLGYYSGALRSEPSQNSPYLDAFSPLLRSEGRNIEMEASSGRVWLQIFRNNRIGLYAMVPQVLLRCDSHPFTSLTILVSIHCP